MIPAVFERASVLVTIDVVYHSKDEMSVEDTHLCRFWCVSNSLTFSSACFKLSLIHFMLEDFPAMEVFESQPKLSYVLGGVGDEHAITVQHVVLPLADVLDAVTVLLLYCLEVEVLSLELVGDFFELIVEECQLVVELKVQLLQFIVHLTDRLLADFILDPY